jgi:ubiquitin-protein ligase
MQALAKEARRAATLSLDSDGVLLRFDPDDMRNVCMCLVGPESTPYEHCFFLLKLVAHENHPKVPPQATYLTTNGAVRFNPNLYADGYVCLSILGTWHEGPGWRPSTLECLGQTIRATVLTETPLRCEPGFSGYAVDEVAQYSRFVEFHSLDFSIAQAIEHPPSGFEDFRPRLAEYFASHMDFYMAKLAYLAAKGDGVEVGDGYEASTVVAQYAETARKLKELYRAVRGEEWVGTGDGGFDPAKRVWYAECDPALAARSAPVADEPDDDAGPPADVDEAESDDEAE